MAVTDIAGAKHFSGLSTDTKPASKIHIGSTFIEEDTANKFQYGSSGWFFIGTILADQDGENITVQNPIPTNGDSVYCKDIDQSLSNITGWTGSICDLFSEIHTEVFNSSSDNPKTIIIHFNRTVEFGAITIGSAEGGDFSNVKITVRNPGVIETIVVDESSDSTKLTNKSYQLNHVSLAESIKLEFLTVDRVGITTVSIPKITSVRVDPHNISDPIHFNDTDSAGRLAFNSIFGERLVGKKKPSISYQYNYGYRDRDFSTTEANGGTVSSADSLITLSTGTNPAGVAVAESVDYLRYVPGHEAYAFFTAVFTQGVANSYQRTGIFDNNDGFFVGFEGVDFKISKRRDGVLESQTVDISKVFTLEEFDPTMGNVYKISFGYLGFANIHFEVLHPDGYWVVIGSFDYPNTSTETSISNTNLPIRGETGNAGNTTDVVISSGSVSAGIVDGANQDPSSRPYTYIRGTTATVTGNNMLVAFRNITTYNLRENRIKAIIQLLSAATEGNKTVGWTIEINPTVTNTPTWSLTDADSIIEFSTDATITFGTGVPGLSWEMGKTASFFEIVESLEGAIRPGDIIAIVVASSGTSEVEFSMRWKELF